MRSVSMSGKIICLVTMLFLLALPLAALAGDVDPTGEKLKSLESDPKYQAKLKELGGANAKVGDGPSWRCACEGATFIGGVIWGERALLDHCKKYDDGRILQYCITYSRHCDHYHWKANCLKEHGCPD